jgi:tol-pal system protein YbgF
MRISALIIAAFLLGGCLATTPPQQDPVVTRLLALEERVAAMERIVRNQSLVQMAQQVSALERSVADLKGSTEELAYNATTTAERQRDLYADLDDRIQALTEQLQSGGGPTVAANDVQAPLLVAPGATPEQVYQSAFGLLQAQQYDQAANGFMQFLAAFPDNDLAGNAQYWLGESYYVTKQYVRALAAFQMVIDNYRTSSKVPDSLLKMGFSNYELKNFAEARRLLERVRDSFADTTAARLAAQRLDRMESEGV